MNILTNNLERQFGFTLKLRLIGILLGWAIAISALSVGQENWPEFRGPTADGVASGGVIPTQFDETTLCWRTPIHGKGWSSPVVWGRQVWLTTATEDGKKMSAICVDLESGKFIHDLVIHENSNPEFCHTTNSYASPTPVIEAGRVYLHFGSYGTTCVDTDTGKTIWQRTDIKCDHYRGPASSPILWNNLLIVAFDGSDVQKVVAFDKETGKTVWQRKREIDYGTDVGDRMKAYGTAAVFDVDGEPLLVYPSAVATIAYRPATGETVWTVYHDGMNASARPLMSADGLLILTNGMGRMVAVDPKGTDDITRNIKWSLTKAVARKSSQVIVGDSLYMNEDKGIMSCVDLKTGKPSWQKRVGGNFASSPIFDGEKLIALSEQGVIYVYRPNSEKMDLVTKQKFGDGFKASPAVSGDRVILRTFSELCCFQNK